MVRHLLLLGAAGPLWVALLLGLVSAANARDRVPVVVSAVEQQPILRQVPLNGSVTSLRSSRLSAATAGLVRTLAVDAGSRVAAGDTLLELDAELARHALASAEAVVREVESALDDARRRLREARELAPQRSIAESVVRDLEAEVVADEAALQKARADADYQRALLARHTVKAPFAGVVSARMTDLGEWVDPGQAIFELVATEELRLDFAVAEDYLEAVAKGNLVHYRLNSGEASDYSGTVAVVVPVTDPGSRTFLVRVKPGEHRPALSPGMSVRGLLRLPTGREGLVIPRDAMLRYPDGRTVVWTVEQGASGPEVSENIVATGLQFEGLVEIVDGLAADARVVVRGNEALQNGQPVSVQQHATGDGGG